MLRTVTQHVLVTYVRPNESMVDLETVDAVNWEKTTAQNSETGVGLNTMYKLSLLVGGAHYYLHQSFGHFNVSDIVVGIHFQDHVMVIIT